MSVGRTPNIDNDGYYQQLDEDRFCEFDDNFFIGEKKLVKKRNEASYKDPKYDLIAAKHSTLSRNGRRRFCEERHKYHAEKKLQSEADFKDGKFANIKPSEVVCKCKNCNSHFVAKKADRKRGWGKFCSKSCKAQYI